jgi:hypothetical protein
VQNFESMLSAFSTSNSTVSGGLNMPNAIEYAANSLNLKSIKLADGDLTVVQSKLKTMGYVLTQNGDTANLKVQVAP